MTVLLKRLEPLNEEALKILYKKQPILDSIEDIRQKMIKECVHPKDHLVHKGSFVLCRFCENRINVNK
jgi:hypothetical protein